jgi:hypothetical protein
MRLVSLVHKLVDLALDGLQELLESDILITANVFSMDCDPKVLSHNATLNGLND